MSGTSSPSNIPISETIAEIAGTAALKVL